VHGHDRYCSLRYDRRKGGMSCPIRYAVADVTNMNAAHRCASFLTTLKNGCSLGSYCPMIDDSNALLA
jgi:hypothetical protein